MALVIEDGTGQPDAESYSDASDADQHVTKWRQSSSWDAASTAAKERSLRRATRFVDSYRFLGSRGFEDQALSWPRVNVGFVDGREIFRDQLPAAIKEATMEAAIRDAEGESLLTDHDGGTVKSESRSVGPMQKQTDYAAPKTAGKRFEAIEALLRPFTTRNKLTRSIA